MNEPMRKVARPEHRQHPELERALDATGVSPGRDFWVIGTASSPCMLCGKSLSSGGEIEHQVVGFEIDRSQGGTNMVRARKRTGQRAHKFCVDALTGGLLGQGTLG